MLSEEYRLSNIGGKYMDEKVINELNAVLKGEHMGIGAYERLINDCKDEKVRSELRKIQNDHKKHIQQLDSRIQALGGEPQHSTGMGGLMASAMGTVESITSSDTLSVLKRAYDGEDQGIAMVEEIVEGDIDAESNKLVKRILSEDHDHLKKMAHMIGEYENRN
jgi:bacterioferritin